MQALIARSDSIAGRVFPIISAELYEVSSEAANLNAKQRAAIKLLELGKMNFSPWQRFLNRNQKGAQQVQFLLFHHRMALEAEVSGLAGRADFFWQEFYKMLAPLLKRDDIWHDAANLLNEPEAEFNNDIARFRQLIVSEVFIDTHCALYNGYLQSAEKLSLDNRAFVHFKRIRELVELSALSKDELRGLLTSSTDTQISLLQDARRWGESFELEQFLLTRFPESEEYQNDLAGLQFAAALDSLSENTSQNVARAESLTLEKTLAKLEKMRADYPYNVSIHQLLGMLNRVYAIRLANAGDLSRSLVAIHKALLLYPSLEGGQETKERLFEWMEKAQKSADATRAQLRSNPNLRLNSEGYSLLRDTQTGFSLVNNYAQSEEAANLSQAAYAARARRYWKLVGLAEPKEQFDSRAIVFYEALNRIFADPPADASEVAAAWHKAASDPSLQDVDHSLVCAFVSKLLFEQGEQQSQPEKAQTVAPANPPILGVRAGKVKKGGEPFSYWLFSKQNLRIKFQAAAAMLLLLIAGGLSIRESLNSNIRDKAYKRILEARDQGLYKGMVEGCERFLSHPALGGDSRRDRVLGYYNEGLVRLVQQESEPRPETLAHLDNYRRLKGNTP